MKTCCVIIQVLHCHYRFGNLTLYCVYACCCSEKCFHVTNTGCRTSRMFSFVLNLNSSHFEGFFDSKTWTLKIFFQFYCNTNMQMVSSMQSHHFEKCFLFPSNQYNSISDELRFCNLIIFDRTHLNQYIECTQRIIRRNKASFVYKSLEILILMMG